MVHVMEVKAGASVGYRRQYTTQRPSRMGSVPVGYGDGYPLALTNCGIVRVEGGEAPVRGEVHMDQILVDLTDLPGVETGSEVELISSDPTAPNALHRLAALAGSHRYELLCRLGGSSRREYIG